MPIEKKGKKESTPLVSPILISLRFMVICHSVQYQDSKCDYQSINAIIPNNLRISLKEMKFEHHDFDGL